MWWSWQLADTLPALSSRSCCLKLAVDIYFIPPKCLLWFSSVSWNKAVMSLEARNAGRCPSLPLFICLGSAPSKFIHCGEPQIAQSSPTVSPTEHPRKPSWKLPGSRSLRPRDYWVCFFLESLMQPALYFPPWGRHGEECWKAANTEGF